MNKPILIFEILLIAALWLALSVFSWLKPADALSLSERRPLTQFPQYNTQTVASGKFMQDFEKYTTDQFPFREKFRTLKALTSKYAFLQKDNNDIYIAEGHASKLDAPMNTVSMSNAAEKIKHLYETYLKSTDAAVYFSIVPDKNYYLAEQNGYLSYDHAAFAEYFQQNFDFAEYIDIFTTLSPEDYYTTDSHWKQENISDTASKIAEAMGQKLTSQYETKTLSHAFYGVYYGQAALPLAPDTLNIQTNSILEACTVYNVENGQTTGIYNMEKLKGNDPYDVFLSGAAPILMVENPQATTDRELILFRDSYGSSLAPLLVEAYSKITLIDTRYVVPEYLPQFVDFSSADDVLFLYCTTLLNNSSTLK